MFYTWRLAKRSRRVIWWRRRGRECWTSCGRRHLCEVWDRRRWAWSKFQWWIRSWKSNRTCSISRFFQIRVSKKEVLLILRQIIVAQNWHRWRATCSWRDLRQRGEYSRRECSPVGRCQSSGDYKCSDTHDGNDSRTWTWRANAPSVWAWSSATVPDRSLAMGLSTWCPSPSSPSSHLRLFPQLEYFLFHFLILFS